MKQNEPAKSMKFTDPMRSMKVNTEVRKAKGASPKKSSSADWTERVIEKVKKSASASDAIYVTSVTASENR